MHKLDPDSWVQRYGNELYRFAFQRVRNAEESADVVQETFLAAWKARDGYRGEISERNWLFTILKRKIIDLYRKRKDTVSLSSDDAAFEGTLFDEAGHWLGTSAPQWSKDTLTEVERKEFHEILGRCLDAMPPSQRSAFVLRYIDEDSAEQICQHLNLTTSTYWVVLHRARHRMRGCMERKWFSSRGRS